MKKVMLFLNGVKKELSRVRWPDKKYMFKYSIAVISLSLFFLFSFMPLIYYSPYLRFC